MHATRVSGCLGTVSVRGWRGRQRISVDPQPCRMMRSASLMGILSELKRRAGDVVAPVIGFCVVGYFAYHSIEGDRGLVAWLRLQEQIRTASSELDGLRAERTALERRVSLLRPESLDRDLLEERVRIVLNFARPEEIIVLDRAAAPPR
jgi:cell division protein FtsB